MMREKIIRRALRCIDEIYPYDVEVNVQQFPLAEFADEAARRGLLSAPLHAIPLTRSFADAPLRENGDGTGSVELPPDFLRLARFRMQGWRRAVLVPVADDTPAYALQSNPYLRGGVAKPVAALTHGGTRLEYFSVPDDPATIAEALYIPFTSLDDTFPERLAEVTAWVLASLVLGVSNDGKGAEAAAARANELMAVL